MNDFQANLETGKVGESFIANWLKARGSSILPVYEKEIDEGKGPQFFARNLVDHPAPDMFVFPRMVWVEAKHKSVFSWYRKDQRWVTGIDRNHYLAYLEVQRLSERPVWLLFLHRSNTPDSNDLAHGCPAECPTGLFGGDLERLSKDISHVSEKWGRHGMVYWAVNVLTKLDDKPS